LKPGGWLVAQCGGGPNLSCLLGRASVLMATEPYVRFCSGWSSPWEYADDITTAERLHAAGFVDVRTGLQPAPVVLADAKQGIPGVHSQCDLPRTIGASVGR
jgi:trans-aconitate 2-methyltransferase